MDAFLSAFKRKGDPGAKKSKNQTNIPWVEKYRPKTIDEVSHQTEVVSVLRKCVEGADLPNLLFYGPPGTGKTSVILAFAKQLFGSSFSERVLELNASDERGINVVRDKVKTFAHLAVSSGSGGSIPPYKLIILDEADSMTIPAQAALRRTMETEMRTTRFCLTCNYVTRIIDPITSRCAKFRFRPLECDVARGRLRHISDAEGLEVTDEVLDHVLTLSHGDLRRGITMLQSVCQFWNPAARVGGPIQIEKSQLDEVAAVLPHELLTNLLESARNGRFDDVQSHVKALLLDGYSAHQTIYQLQTIIMDELLSDARKGALLDSFALADARLVEGGDEYLQLLSVGGNLIKAFS